MIEVRDVRKVFNSGRPNEFAALRGVTMEIEPLKVTAIEGPSGSGKTSLLSIIGCMTRPTSGRVWLEGTEITSLPERFLTSIRRKTFGFVFQQFHLIRGITAIENVMLAAYPTGEARQEIRARALELLLLLDIRQKAESKVQWLSGGEAQRVAIARALVNGPEVLIADEPTAHLDTKLSEEFMEIFKGLKAQGMTIIISSHDPIVVNSAIVDSVHIMRDGVLA